MARSKRGFIGRLMCLAMVAAFGTSSGHAEALKMHYSGSSMASDSSGRVITIEFAKDGTGSYQENSGKRNVDTPIHWLRKGKTVTVALEPDAGKQPDAPLVFELKRKSLVPVGAKESQLGVFAFPTLHPFGPGDVGVGSGMTTCVTGAPGPCLQRETWNSNKSAK